MKNLSLLLSTLILAAGAAQAQQAA
ncbi:MAG: hypothetical protein JWP59_2295, partial [Massilia sp.]|nr:hypothetical protein [Massilia sp.]